MKKRLIDGLLGVVIGIIMILLLMPKHEDISDQLKEKDRIYGKKIDSLEYTITVLKTKDKLLLNTIKILRADKSKIIREKELYRIKYERLKNTPVPVSHLNDDQLDSLITTIYTR